MKRGFRWFGRVVMGLLVCLCLASISGAAPTEQAQSLLNQVLIRPILDSGSFQVNGETFQHILVPQSALDRYAESEFAVYPGETHDLVRQWKLFLYSEANFPGNEYVTYSQVRPPNTRNDIDSDYWIEGDDYESVLYYFDDHLKMLIDTVYLFCGIEDKEPCLDELTCYLLSLVRMMHPGILLPSTTALGSLIPGGREKGILAGANVLMPNLSPVSVRAKYMLYDGKICTGDEAAECRRCMELRMEKIGYHVAISRGDSLVK